MINTKKNLLAISSDYSNFDATLNSSFTQVYLEKIFPFKVQNGVNGMLLKDLLRLEMNAAIIGPGKTSGEGGRLYHNDGSGKAPTFLTSGMSHTSLITSVTNVQILAEAISFTYGYPPFVGYRDWHDYWIFGDDCVLYLPEKNNRVIAVLDYISSLGFKIKQEPGATFLMKVMTPDGPTNIIHRVIQSFFEGERPKNDPGIVSVMIGANDTLIKNHPCYNSYVNIMDKLLKSHKGIANKGSYKEVMSWYMSADMKQYLYDYAKTSRNTADEIADIFNAVTSGMISSGEDTEIIEKLFGIQYSIPSITVSRRYAQMVTSKEIFSILSAFAAELNQGQEIGRVDEFIRRYGFTNKKDEYL